MLMRIRNMLRKGIRCHCFSSGGEQMNIRDKAKLESRERKRLWLFFACFLPCLPLHVASAGGMLLRITRSVTS